MLYLEYDVICQSVPFMFLEKDKEDREKKDYYAIVTSLLYKGYDVICRIVLFMFLEKDNEDL